MAKDLRNQIHLLKISEKEVKDQSKILQSFMKSYFLKKFMIQMKLLLII